MAKDKPWFTKGPQRMDAKGDRKGGSEGGPSWFNRNQPRGVNPTPGGSNSAGFAMTKEPRLPMIPGSPPFGPDLRPSSGKPAAPAKARGRKVLGTTGGAPGPLHQ